MKMRSLKKILKDYQYVFFATVMTIIVLWQLLLPGYVLLLDWVPGPVNPFKPQTIFQFMGAPFEYVILFAQSIVPAWAVQKMLLFSIVFLLFYLPLRFYTFERGYGVEYFASLVFAINPWVYERMISGQWKVVFGYLLMIPLVYYLITYHKNKKWREVFYIFSTLMLLQIISNHFFVIGIIVTAVFVLMQIIADITRLKLQNVWRLIYQLVGVGVVFLVLSLYWIVPFTLADKVQTNTLSSFDSAHFEAFRTASDKNVGLVGNVLMMHGFWEEHEPWIERFTLPKDALLWYLLFVLFVTLVILGIWRLFFSKREYFITIFLLAIALLGVIFGIGNSWMFEHISFWRGFRDSQKWVGLLVVVYAVFASQGVHVIATSKILYKKIGGDLKERSKRINFKIAVLTPLFFLPLLMMPMMLFGFVGQLNTTWYPQEWYQVNEVLKTESKKLNELGRKCKVIFLPWQQYYFAKFNGGQLIANPAKKFFGEYCEVLSGQNMELGKIHMVKGLPNKEYLLYVAIVFNNIKPADALRTFRRLGVTHIINTDDKPYFLHAYKFIPYGLRNNEINQIYNSQRIQLYDIQKSLQK